MKTNAASGPGATTVLFASNGHGEDEIACKVLDRLRTLHPDPLELAAWPMVGEGHAYRKRGVPVIGALNTLPGEGFGTLNLALFLRDLRHGFIGTHWRQARFARSLRGQFGLVVGCGDIIPLVAGRLAATRMAFISCAKSAYYGGRDGHTGAERALMRGNCPAVFPRDAMTAHALSQAGVPVRYRGNPMMDDLAPSAAPPLTGPPAICIAMLAGSRRDAAENTVLLLQAANRLCSVHADPHRLRFLFPVYRGVDLTQLRAGLSGQGDWMPGDWDRDIGARAEAMVLQNARGARALLIKHRFADVLHTCGAVVGMAGTANEQALGLGLPLVTVPGRGNQGASYARMKQRFYGESAVAAAHDPEDIAVRLSALLSDPAKCAAMAATGRARMGDPGASAAIAEDISALLLGTEATTKGEPA